MAEKSGDKGAPTDERLFTVPLRKEWLKVPMNKRARRSAKTIKSHLSRHMKVPETAIRISGELNKALWIRGAGKPPGKIRLKASFDAKAGLLHATLPDEKPPVKEEKKGKDAATEEAGKAPPVKGEAKTEEAPKEEPSKEEPAKEEKTEKSEPTKKG
jgi:ribosomal protein L31E